MLAWVCGGLWEVMMNGVQERETGGGEVCEVRKHAKVPETLEKYKTATEIKEKLKFEVFLKYIFPFQKQVKQPPQPPSRKVALAQKSQLHDS